MSFKVMEMKGRAMTKKLKIRFVKFECALAMQVLEQKGYFDSMKHVRVSAYPAVDETCVFLRGREKEYDYSVKTIRFNDNAERDEYLNKVIKWISEEQFADGSKLKIGEKCLFSDDGTDWHSGKYGGKGAKQLGEPRFLSLDDDWFTRWKYVKPLPLCGAPKTDGDIYTWEERE